MVFTSLYNSFLCTAAGQRRIKYDIKRGMCINMDLPEHMNILFLIYKKWLG